MTGDRPTGKLHLGHYVGSLANRVKLQDEYRQFIIMADMQALTDNAENPEKVRDNIIEVALDYLAVGIDPEKSTIFIQSLIPEISELAMYFMNLVTLARAERNPTVKDEMRQKGFGADVPVGLSRLSDQPGRRYSCLQGESRAGRERSGTHDRTDE